MEKETFNLGQGFWFLLNDASTGRYPVLTVCVICNV